MLPWLGPGSSDVYRRWRLGEAPPQLLIDWLFVVERKCVLETAATLAAISWEAGPLADVGSLG